MEQTTQESSQEEQEDAVGAAAQVNRLRLIHPVETRAAARRREQREKSNEKATQSSGAVITTWEDVLPLEEDSQTPTQPPIQTPSAPIGPLDKTTFMEAQRQDHTLRKFFRQSEEKTGAFHIFKDLIYQRDIDPAGEPR